MRTNYRHKRASVRESGGHWLSFSDMMSVLVLIFIFVVFSMLSTLAQDEGDIEAMRADYDAQVLALSAELTDTQDKLSQAQTENLQIVILTQQRDDANALLAEAQTQLDATNALLADNTQAQTTVIDLRSQLERTQSELEAARSEAIAQSAIISGLNSQLERAREEADNDSQLILITSLQTQLDEANQTIVALNGTVLMNENSIRELNARIAALTDGEDTLARELGELRASSLAGEAALLELRAQYNSVVSQLETANERIAVLTDTNTELTEANLTLTDQNQTLAGDNAALTDENQRLLAQNGTLVSRNRTLSTENEMLVGENNTLSGQNRTLNTQLSALEAQNETLLSENASLVDSNAALTGERATLLETLTDVEGELADARSVVSSLDDQLSEYQRQLAQRQGELERMIGVKAEIIEELSNELSSRNITVQVDPQTGAITLPGGMLFDVGQNQLSADGKAYLDEFLPIYLNVLMADRFKDYVAEIIIEGHTDSTGKAGEDPYLYNLELSQQRALSVSDYVLAAGYMQNTLNLSAREQEQLRKLITSSGRSFSALIYRGGTEDKEASRRVEIKFRLSDDETIASMEALLRLMERNEGN